MVLKGLCRRHLVSRLLKPLHCGTSKTNLSAFALVSERKRGGRDEEMVSKRQQLARKRFLEANPHLLPKPDPPKDPSSKKKKLFKKTLKGKPNTNKKGSSNLKKHPLRVPGMRPGESCFICKSTDHIAKLCPQKSEWEKHKICLVCRQRGHSLKNCPDKGESIEKKLCYNCGENGHSLSKCPQPLQNGGTKFASCFICNEQGHLSKNCPKNKHGIYPKGGSCKICGGVTHLAKDCPNKGSKSTVFASKLESTGSKLGESWKGQLTVFRSGDDLEDDFTIEDEKGSKKGNISQSFSESVAFGADNENSGHVVNPKKKQGPKVVNFLG